MASWGEMVPSFIDSFLCSWCQKNVTSERGRGMGEGRGCRSHVQLYSWLPPQGQSEGNALLFDFVSATQAVANHLRFFKKRGARVNHFWRSLMFTSLSGDKRASSALTTPETELALTHQPWRRWVCFTHSLLGISWLPSAWPCIDRQAVPCPMPKCAEVWVDLLGEMVFWVILNYLSYLDPSVHEFFGHGILKSH